VDSSAPVRVAHWTHLQLPVGLLFFNTFLLLLSSATMEMARRQVTKRAALAPVERIPGVSLGRERNLPWLTATIVLGCAFVSGQCWHGTRWAPGDLSLDYPQCYVRLPSHHFACYPCRGWVAGIAQRSGACTCQATWDSRRIVVDVTTWYWHFMAALWVYLFALVALMN